MSGCPLLLDGLWCHVHTEVMLIGVTREVPPHCWGHFPLLSSLLWHEPLLHLCHTEPFTPFPSSKWPSKICYIWSTLVDYLQPLRSWITPFMWPFLRFVPYGFSFKSSGNVVYWPSSFFPSPDPPWASKEHFTQTPTYSILKLNFIYCFIYCVFCCNESFCSYVYKSKYRENDTAIPVYFHIFGEMWKRRNYSAVLTAVRAGTFHYTVLTLSHSILSCHLSSFQICSSFACIAITAPLVPAPLVGDWVERDGHMKLSQMNCSWDNEVEVAGA